ncbi:MULTISPECIES: hypothetical protein [Gordonibacter]|uniref:Uncharacterized protein n=1 Tax=Gordonibacter faecis TaxID=3047475 RepID=A0ABT7DLC8_9ACTN|nr:hypothetical protein [Gordonibacter sp. KGMB12511]MDJ1650212.1 hypothetical protein [Gordonibacter sp. KGMB12511]HIW75954.1 hypothetical protein [Candidatus Gordonibacter avicola]
MEDIPLISYVMQGGGPTADPIYRVAPCLNATINKLASVTMCCQGLATVEDSHCESKALLGAISILHEVMEEIDEALEVLDEVATRQTSS